MPQRANRKNTNRVVLAKQQEEVNKVKRNRSGRRALDPNAFTKAQALKVLATLDADGAEKFLKHRNNKVKARAEARLAGLAAAVEAAHKAAHTETETEAEAV
jgi:hypothetical protein